MTKHVDVEGVKTIHSFELATSGGLLTMKLMLPSRKRDHAIGVPADLCVCNGHKGHVTRVFVESIFMDQEPVVRLNND